MGLAYRPDIEGLRAVAILLVVAAHAHAPGLAGGFVGVDVFFVLSGYLITSLLQQELAATGRIDFLAFYARRLRRLLPALLVALAVTLLLAAALDYPEMPDQLAAGSGAAFWLSNLYFSFANQGYFDPGAESNLFLHTWSLGVEEQFYLVWPLLVAVVAPKLGTRRTMLGLFVVSLTACLWLSVTHPTWAFYMMPTRAWQFALGALVIAYRAPAWAGLVGLALVIGSSALIQPDMTYPGLLALIPSAGAALALSAAPKLLAARPLQAIGNVSYGWYLWHWPMLLLGERLRPDMEPIPRAALMVGVSLALAFLSHRMIEAPIRRARFTSRRPAWFVTTCVVVMSATCVMSLQARTSAQNSADALAWERASRRPEIYAMGCDDYYRSARLNPCVFGSGDRTVVVIGDSIGLQWFPALKEIFADRRLVVLTKSGCPMVDAPVRNARTKRRFVECETWRKDALAYVQTLRPDTVILGSSRNYDLTQQQWEGGTARVLRQISAKQVFVIAPTPPVNARIDANAVFKWQRNAGAGMAYVRFLDMNPLVCPTGLCAPKSEELFVYRDSEHLAVDFARSLAVPLRDMMRFSEQK